MVSNILWKDRTGATYTKSEMEEGAKRLKMMDKQVLGQIHTTRAKRGFEFDANVSKIKVGRKAKRITVDEANRQYAKLKKDYQDVLLDRKRFYSREKLLDLATSEVIRRGGGIVTPLVGTLLLGLYNAYFRGRVFDWYYAYQRSIGVRC